VWSFPPGRSAPGENTQVLHHGIATCSLMVTRIFGTSIRALKAAKKEAEYDGKRLLRCFSDSGVLVLFFMLATYSSAGDVS
jgi:hypothetical protein